MSRILLISDIHANLPALDAVLADAERHGAVDQVWSLGDAVGYGPRPNECLDRLRGVGAVAVAGNHELAAVGSITATDFNSYARAAIQWTQGVLSPGSVEHIKSMSRVETLGEFTLVHGSLRDPVWEYVTGHAVAAANLPLLETPHCVSGHTHVPAAISVSPDEPREVWPNVGDVVELHRGRWFVNPGSVGQPRDRDPRASYAIIDSADMTVSYFRVEYPVAEVQHQMKQIGLPVMLIERLALGR